MQKSFPFVTSLGLPPGQVGRARIYPKERVGHGFWPASFGQKRLWFLAQLEGASHAYHIPLCLRLIGALDEAALKQALDRLVRRHETLRTTFFTVDGEVFQQIRDENTALDFRRQDLRGFDDAEELLAAQVREEASAPFDLEQGSLIRCRLIRTLDEEHVLLITMHHIISDGWSVGILRRELGALYKAFSAGETDPLAPLTIQYADYAAWQREWLSADFLTEQSAYWERALGGAPSFITLPTDRPRPHRQDFTGGSVPLVLDEVLTAGLRALSRRYGLTLFMTVLTGWALVLSRLADQQDVVIGIPSANRGRSEIEGLIGFFVSTLALRIDLSEAATVAALLEQVKRVALEAQAHQDLPFEQIVELVKPVRNLGHTPIFQVMFAWQNNERTTFDLPGLIVDRIRAGEPAAKFDLTLNLGEVDGKIVGQIIYATSLFERQTIERYAEYLRKALSEMVADANRPAAALPILSDAERQQLLVEWNATEADYPHDKCIHDLFAEQVERAPEATAVVYEDQSLSYGELNARANRLAHHLRSLGVKPDAPVAICVERSLEMIVGLLAILKAGGCYLPLDPEYPPERLSFMLKDAAPKIILTHAAVRRQLEETLVRSNFSGTVLDLDRDADDWAHCSASNPSSEAIGLKPHHLAYIIYTSGSTGEPKGVMVEHKNLQSSNAARLAVYGDVKSFLLTASFAFDSSVAPIFSTLTNHGTLILLPEKFTQDVRRLSELVERHKVEGWNCSPSLYRALLEVQGRERLSSLTAVIVAGEQLHPELLRLHGQTSSATQVYNEYGPTEATIWATVYRCAFVTDGLVPIGRPISNTRIYLLDGMGNPVPQGVSGEIYIGGAGVARGYLNRPELTAERFIASPFVAGDRLYKTGDLGRYLADGNIEFLGRNDFQVKIRGFRIELGEIEARLLSHPSVREAVVIAREDEPGNKRLVAYYTAKEETGAEELRRYLSVSLPDYMVPAAYVRLDVLPLTLNGKLDRKALPAPEDDAYGRKAYEAPVGPVETAVAQIWSEVLGVERVGRRDNFFELGGHSLLAIRVLERMRRASLQADVKAFFTAPVLAELAQAVGRTSDAVGIPVNLIPAGCEWITPALLPLVDLSQDQINAIADTVSGGHSNIQDIYPLAPLQDGILFHHLMAQEGDPYLLWRQLSFPDRAVLDRYVAALNAVIARHDILRTAIVWEGLTEPVQVVWRHAPVAVEEVPLDPRDGDIATQLKERFHPRHYRIDVRRAPLQRLFIAHDPEKERWVMMMLRHHLVYDAASIVTLNDEIAAYFSGRSAALPVALPFRNFVAQARLGVSREEHEIFFQKMLGDVDEPTAPFGLMDVQGDGSGISQAHVMLEGHFTRRIRSKARSLGVSVASLCHVAWALVVSRCSGQQDPVFGTILFGRMQGGEGADRALGLFINTLPVKISLGPLGVQESVIKAHQLLAELMHHEHASLALAQRCSGVKAPAPLFTSLLNYRHSTPQAKGAAERPRPLEGIRSLGGEVRNNYPITLSVEDLGEELGLTTLAVASVGAERVCAMMQRALEQLVEALELDPQRPVGRLDVLAPSERQQLLVEWNATEADYPHDKCIHDLFAEQVERAPEATAVVYEDQSLSYGELNARANRLAHHLRSLGVKPDAPVAICVERSLEMIVGLLAILKAGGCYLPLDPEYPPERLSFMLKDAAPKIILTHAAVRATLQAVLDDCSITTPVFDLDRDADDWAHFSASNPSSEGIGLKPHHLAYIIYTSGSTGEPKGVMVAHRSLANYLSCIVGLIGRNKVDSSLVHSDANFDLTITSLFPPILCGGSIKLLAPIENDQVTPLLNALEHESHSNCFSKLTPSHLSALQAALGKRLPVYKCSMAFVGGEQLTGATLRPWKENSLDCQFINHYGPTETTVGACCFPINDKWQPTETVPIGRPISNTRIYLLDGVGNPVPQGVSGEIYIGGAGVARGYLNRPELTAERFIASPFVAGDRLYKTGDLGRYLADGNIEFLGRNDFQVKIRGFRIELGEIEARLLSHPSVREAVVIAREDEPGNKRLVAYYTAKEETGAEELRRYLSVSLPDYMVPAAYVRLDVLPLTLNGKLDRKALPAPEDDAYGRKAYEAPVGPAEAAIAEIWSEVLGLAQISRHDDFFELGGHSLLAIRVLERMRRAGLQADVKALFTAPVLAELAQAVGRTSDAVEVPVNLIPAGCEWITPALLPLVDLSQDQINAIADTVSGGHSNIQDIYPLAPLQDGILFHHLMAQEGDPYLLWRQLSFPDRAVLDQYVAALNAVIARHDILRTAIVWEGLTEPVQVVWRHAPVAVEEVPLDPRDGDIATQLKERFYPRHYRIDVRRAPLQRLFIAHDPEKERWVMMQLRHHLSGDHVTTETMQGEIAAYFSGRSAALPVALPFRNFVAQARLGVSREEHEIFFQKMLGDVDEPTAPFGLMDVQGDGSGISQAHVMLEGHFTRRIRSKARSLGVSVASLCHVAWALVVSRCSGQQDPVFGTVLFGRMQGGEGADRALGLFINTLPVKISLGPLGAQESVIKAHQLLAELMHHEHASLALAQRCSGVKAPAPLFTSLLNYRHSTPQAKGGPSPFNGVRSLGGEERTNYPITLSVEDLGEELGLTTLAVAFVGAERVCAMMQRALEQLVEALELDPQRPVGRLDVLAPSERQQLLVEWNATEADYPHDKCIHDLFAEQVERAPEATAVVYEDQSLSYGELNARANRLAHHLRSLGVKPDAPVAICVERSLEMIVGLLAILKAGGCYLPLDPEYPPERLSFMLKDAAPKIILTHAAVRRQLEETLVRSNFSGTVLDLDRDADDWAHCSASNPSSEAIGLKPHHLAYIIYTSGSTGEPKGVMVVHESVVNRVLWMRAAYQINFPDTVLQKTPFSFDVSVWEFFCTLLAGARLVVVRPHGHKDADYLRSIIQEKKITICHFVPSMLGIFVSSKKLNDLSLKKVFCSGEELSNVLAEQFHNTFRGTELHNLYGPTEATVDVTAWESLEEISVFSSSPIGRPISNTRIYLLDGMGNPVPQGVSGEIYIGGAGVARGYLNRPELTAERFIASPFVAGDRLYKTGDLGRYLADGNIEFLGRNDFQVKIRGFRIELGEIEARLLSHPSVREAVVIAREDEPGNKRLVAYYTAKEETGAEELRRYLSVSLPDYMVPAAYVRLDVLPLTLNGKLDRKALPAPEDDAYGRKAYEAPVGPVETAVAQIWSEVLGVERVGRRDNFFELGGHSLLAIRVLERMRRAGLQADVKALFTAPVLAELARIVIVRGLVIPPIPVADRNRPLVLSFSQQRLWFLAQMTGASEAYHISLGLRLTGQLNEDAFRRSLNVLVARHETLRTTFFTLDGEAFQRVGPADAEFSLQREDLRGLGADALWQRLRDAVKAPFDLEQGPLVRGILLELSDEEHVLLITMHHIVSDGWSAGIFVRELSALYRAYCSAEEFLLPPLPIQYADYAAWQRQWLTGETFAQQSAYWQRTLSGAPALLQLPTDHPRPDYQDFDGNYVLVHLDETLTSGLKDLSQRHSLTLFMTVLTGWALVLSRLADQQDVVIGIPSANRGRSEIEGLIGFFVSTLALRIDLSEAATVAALLEQVKRVALEAQAHQDLPFEQIVELVKPVRNLGHTPIFQVMFAWQNNERTTFDLPGLIVDRIRAGEPAAKFDLTLNLGEVDGKIVGQIIYATSLFERQTIERYAEYLRKALSEMVADANRPAAALPILSDAERQQLLVEWNATEADYPHDKCIHDLFAEQVERAPEATAVVYEDQSLSYGELNARANRLAHHLRSLGVKPDAPVAICVERSLEMIVGLLAILKAGGCYLPLDPEYPPERLSFMLKDAAPKIILTHAAVRRQLEETLVRSNFSGTVLDLDRDADDWAHCSASNPPSEAIGLTSRHLAYIIYTSGSTGEPKGVMVEHKNLQSSNAARLKKYGIKKRILLTPSFSFDSSVAILFWSLTSYSILLIAPARALRDTRALANLIIKHEPNTWLCVPSLYQALLNIPNFSELNKLDVIILAGEKVQYSILSQHVALSSHGIMLFNEYGPTETTVWAAVGECSLNSSKTVPIGRPISNTRIYLLDGVGNPVPQGVSGEIYIGGAGVARGYLNRPELTAERFIASPFVAGDRLYKTGDLGRYLADGNIEFLGRNDFQVKIRGFRIELGEIEARLLSHPSVREAVVIAREDEPGNKRLVAYYTAKEETGAEELRRYLSVSLPDYMVPAAYVRLDVLPLTLNGKLDRKALPAPEDDAYGRKAYEAPVGPVETAVAQIWSEVLGVERVGRRDNFFELGGHSLLAIRVLERMRRAGLQADVKALFTAPVLAELCEEMEETYKVVL